MRKINFFILLILWVIIFQFVSCDLPNSKRAFFPQVIDTVFFSTNCYWHIDLKPSRRKLNGELLYKTYFKFPDREFAVWSKMENDQWIMCDKKAKDCDITFDFSSRTPINIDDIIKTQLLDYSDGNYLFSYIVAGGRGHSNFPDLLVWGISKDYGLTSLGYYNKYWCNFEYSYGDTIYLKKHEPMICTYLESR